MDRKWQNLAKVVYSGLHNIPFISTPPPCSDCHHLIYMKIDKMPSAMLSPLLSEMLGVGNTCSRHGSAMEKPKFPFARGLLLTAIQITPCVYWKRPSLPKTTFLKQVVGFYFIYVYTFFFFRPMAYSVISAHESIRINVTGPGQCNYFCQCHT